MPRRKLVPAESLESREMLTSVTIMSHGAKVTGQFLPGLPIGYADQYTESAVAPDENDHDMRNALYQFFNDPAKYPNAGVESTIALNYQPASGELVEVVYNSGTNQYVENPSFVFGDFLLEGYDNVIVLFDWLNESAAGGLGGGFDESAGDALFSMIVDHNLDESDYLHLLGMSRGHVAVSEASQRLLSHGRTVEHVTLLDGEHGHLMLNDAGLGLAWEGVDFVDNYYRHESYHSTPVLGALGLAGSPRDGAVNMPIIHASGIVPGDPYPIYPSADQPENPGDPTNGKVDHPEVKGWYTTSILNAGSILVGSPDEDYTSTGYAYRHDAALRTAAQAQSLIDNPSVFDVNARPTPVVPPPSIINGDFEFDPGIFGRAISGWVFHGGQGTAEVVKEDGNRFLRLESATPAMQHNRLYIPEGAGLLQMVVRVGAASPIGDNALRVFLGGVELELVDENGVVVGTGTADAAQLTTVQGTGEFRRLRYRVPAAMEDGQTTGTLKLEITSDSNSVTSVVDVDNLYFGLGEVDPGVAGKSFELIDFIVETAASTIHEELTANNAWYAEHAPIIWEYVTDRITGIKNRMLIPPQLAALVTPDQFVIDATGGTAPATDAYLAVSIDEQQPVIVRVPVADMIDNHSVLDLAADVEDALSAAGFGSQLTVEVISDGRLQVEGKENAGINTASFSTLMLEATGAGIDPTILANGQINALLGPIDDITIELTTPQYDSNGNALAPLVDQYVIPRIGFNPPAPTEAPFVFTADNIDLEEFVADLNVSFATAVNAAGESAPLNALTAFVTDAGTIGLIATDPSISGIKVVSGGARLGLDNGATIAATTNANTAVTHLGFGSTVASTASQGATAYARAPYFTWESFAGHLWAEVAETMPWSNNYDPNIVYDEVAKTIEFDLKFSSVSTDTIPLDWSSGFDLFGGKVEVSAFADAEFELEFNFDARVGIDLDGASQGSAFTINNSTPLADLNSGDGVNRLVGMAAANTAPANGQIGNDVNFGIELQTSGQTYQIDLELLNLPDPSQGGLLPENQSPSTSDNSSAAMLVTDLNKLFTLTEVSPGEKLSEWLTADLIEQVSTLGVATSTIALRATDTRVRKLYVHNAALLGFTGNDAYSGALNPLTLNNTVASQWDDLVIALQDGDSFEVNLDSAETIGEVITLIENASILGSPRVDVTFNADGNGLRIEDLTTGGGTFAVMPNGVAITSIEDAGNLGQFLPTLSITSPAAEMLDLLGMGGTVIEGGTLEGDDDGYFYIIEGVTGHDHISIAASLTSDVDVTAAYDDIALSITSAPGDPLLFEATAALQLADPGIGAAQDGRVYGYEIAEDPAEALLSGLSLLFAGSGVLDVTLDVFDNGDLQFIEDLLGLGNPFLTLQFGFEVGLGGAAFAPLTAPPVDGLPPARSGTGSTGSFVFTPSVDFDVLLEQLEGFGIDDVVSMLRRFANELKDNPDIDLLNQNIPLVNKSINDVVSIADGILAAADQIVNGVTAQDLVEIEAARLELETAVGNLGLSLVDREPLLRQIEMLRRFAGPIDQNAPADFLDRLPTRLLSAVAQFGKLIGQTVPPGTAGYNALIDKFRDLASLVPALSSIEDRLANALEDKINEALGGASFDAEVSLAFKDFDGDLNDLSDRFLVMGLTLDEPQLVSLDLAPADLLSAEFGPIELSLDADLQLTAGGQISVGLAVDTREVAGENRTYLLVNDPNVSDPDIIPTELLLGLGLDTYAEGGLSFGSIEALEAKGYFSILESVRETFTPATSVLLGDTPVYFRDDQAIDDDGRSMIVVVKDGTSSDVLSFQQGDYRLVPNVTPGDPPTLEIINSPIDLLTATEVVVEYQSASIPGPSENAGGTSLERTTNYPASFDVRFTPQGGTTGNALGAVAFDTLFVDAQLDTDLQGLLVGALDASLLGNSADNLLVLAASLNHLTQPQITVDPAAAGSLLELDFDLKTIVAGLDKVLAEIEEVLIETNDAMPMVGGNFDVTDTFVGKLRSKLTLPLLDLLCNADGALASIDQEVTQFVFDALGPSGLGYLQDQAGNGTTTPDGVIDQYDVIVELTESEFTIDVQLGGHDEYVADFDIDLGDLISLQGEGGIEFGWDFSADLAFGVSKSQGFFLLDQATPEIELSISAGLYVDDSVPGDPVPTSMTLSLFGLGISATDKLRNGETSTYLRGDLTLDVTDGNGDGRIMINEITGRPLSTVFQAGMSAQAEVNLELSLGINDNLPSLQTDLFIGSDDGTGPTPWELTLTQDAQGKFSFDTSGDFSVQFQDLGINLGDFLTKNIGPVVRSVDKYIDPIKPVINYLTREVPGISDVSQAIGKGPVYFIDLAFARNPEKAEAARKFVFTVKAIADTIDMLASVDPADNLFVVLVDQYQVVGPGPSMSNQETAALSTEGFANAGLAQGIDNVTGKLRGILDNLNEIGVDIHLLSDPTNLVQMLLHQPFDVVSWDLPRFELPFTWEKSLPIIPFPKIDLRIGLDAYAFADISVGFDSHGIDTGNFFNGFYFGDREMVFAGDDIDEFGIGAGVRLAALLDVLVAEAGVEGAVTFEGTANWNDLNNNGKLHADEIATIIRTNDIHCLFDLEGEVRAIVRAVWKVFGAEGSKEFVNVLLASWTNDCSPYENGHVSTGEALPGITSEIIGANPAFGEFNEAGTLVLHAGAFATQRGPGLTSDTDETFAVEELVAPSASNNQQGVYEVRAFGLTSRYSGVKRIYFDGGLGDDLLDLVNVTVPVAAFGGAGDDFLPGTRNTDLLDGGIGDDTLFARGGADYVFAGPGSDTVYSDLESGNTDTALWGVGAGDFVDAGPGNDTVYTAEGNDTVDLGSGDDILHASMGADMIDAGSGNDLIYAGEGNDEVDGGFGNDVIYADAGNDTVRGDAGRDIIFGEQGNDNIDAGTGPDVVFAGIGNDVVTGGGGSDLLIGGLGADNLSGGTGLDLIAGGLATSHPPLSEAVETLLQDATLFSEVQTRELAFVGQVDGNDTLFGDQHNDLLIGDQGDDHLFGGWGNDSLIGHHVEDQSSPSIEYIEGGPGSDLICSAGGGDTLIGGTGDLGLAHILSSTPGPDLGGGFTVSCDDQGAGGIQIDLPPTEGSIAGVAFDDTNADGVRDADELTLAGWTITLYDNYGDALDAVVTDSSGEYVFELLPQGDYTLEGEDRFGWVRTVASVSLPLAAAAVEEDVDFGFKFDGATIAGRKWHDLNADGVIDATEPGIDNWEIELLDAAGNVIDTTRTFSIDLDGSGTDGIDSDGDTLIDEADERYTPDERGFYEFTGLPAGEFAVREVSQAGWLQGSPTLAEAATFLAIPDDGFTSLESFAQVGLAGASVASVEVTFDIEHESRQDLRIELVSPEGTRITLLNTVAGTGQDFRNITFSDSATTPIADFSQNSGGTLFLPEETLAQLTGEAAGGMWTLLVRDELFGLTGKLNSWSISVNGEPPVDGEAGSAIGENSSVAMLHEVLPGELVMQSFGNFRPAVVEGYKFYDRNANGVWDQEGGNGESEPGLAGVVIYADLNNNATLDRGEPQTVTQADDPSTLEEDETGYYTLEILPVIGAGITIRELAPPGWTPTAPSGQAEGHVLNREGIASGQVLSGFDFGNAPPATVSGQKWLDLDANGRWDGKETGFDGIVIYADLNNNGIRDEGEPADVTHSVTTVTEATGDYNLDGVVNAADFTVWRDADLTQDQRADGNDDNVVDQGDYELWAENYGRVRIVTMTHGHYTLSNVPAGSVVIREELPGAYYPTFPEAGNYQLVLSPEDSLTGYDFGNAREQEPRNDLSVNEAALFAMGLASSGSEGPVETSFAAGQGTTITGLKYEDLNGNGTRDQGEPGLEDWTIELIYDANADGVIDLADEPLALTTQTDSAGFYHFDGLTPDTYIVREQQQPGFVQTSSGGINIDNRLVPQQGRTNWRLTVKDGEVWEEVDFGNQQMVASNSISGTKFEDLDGDGIRDQGEPGLQGWVIELIFDANADGAIDLSDYDFAITTQTGDLGEYRFDNLEPVEYLVREQQQQGFTQTSPGGVGFNGNLMPSPGTTDWSIFLEPGQLYEGVDFGNHRDDISNYIQGVKYHDLNANGVKEVNEPGLGGWTIVMEDLNGQVFATATTATSTDPSVAGTYEFVIDPIVTGEQEYRFYEVQQAGWQQTSSGGIGDSGSTQSVPGTTDWVLEMSIGSTPIFYTDIDFGNNRIDQLIPLPDGDDTINAGGGDDQVWGDNHVSNPLVVSIGTRNDTLFGQEGNDTLFGQEGDDIIWGADAKLGVVFSSDDDTLDGGDGIDEVRQTVDADQALTDTSLSGQGTDSLTAFEKATLVGGASANLIDASAFSGPLSLVGKEGNDTLIGGAFADTLAGGFGDDLLQGGADDDTYLFGSLNPNVVETDTVDEASLGGVDTLDFSASDFAVSVDLSGAMTANQIAESSGAGGSRLVQVNSAGQEDHLENLIGTHFDDTLIGNDGDNRIHLLDGTDSADAGGGADTVHVGTGDATINGGTGNDLILFEEGWGQATVSDASGVDELDFSAITIALDFSINADSSVGITDGSNQVTTSIALERLIGGLAGDTFRFEDTASLAALGHLDGREGIDLLSYFLYTSGVSVNLSAGTATGVPDGVAAIENVTGGTGGDSLIGDDGPNTLAGGPGADPLIDGRAGNDVLLGGAGDDGSTGILGGLGNDLLIGGGGLDFLDGQAGSDLYRMLQADGSDTIQDSGTAAELDRLDLSSISDDLLIEFNGTDVFGYLSDTSTLFESNNTLEEIVTGDGDDTFAFQANAAMPGQSLLDAGDGHNTIDYTQYAAGVTVNLSTEPWQPTAFPAGSATGVDSITGFIDIVGSDFNDLLIGNSSANKISPLDGNDEAHGLEGNDEFVSTAGVDQLWGGTGNDLYRGEHLLFTMNELGGQSTGGQVTPGGIDTVDVSQVTQTVLIDLTSFPEIENFYGSLTMPNAITGNAKDNLIVGGSQNDVLLGNDGDDFLIGLAGDDRLEGGDGNDILLGGDGDDSGAGAFLLGGDGRDILVGGLGVDDVNALDGFEDILITESTVFDTPTTSNLAAWKEFSRVWALTNRTSAQRQALLASGVDAGFGPVSLDQTALIDDLVVDSSQLDEIVNGDPVEDWNLSAGFAFAYFYGASADEAFSSLQQEDELATLKATSALGDSDLLLLLSQQVLGAEKDEPSELSQPRQKTAEDRNPTPLEMALASEF